MIRKFDLGEFCAGIALLYPDSKWDIDVPPGTPIRADESLMRQVLINLIKNAREADARTLSIHYIPSPAVSHENSVFTGTLEISNDGHAIPDDVAREMFIPFFTTKPQGSGIGLALSRQILLTQGIILRLADHPAPGFNVTFILEPDRL